MSLFEMFSRKAEWESAIGRLMLSSARLEMNVLMAIANYGSDGLARKAVKQVHASRLTILENLASDRNADIRKAVAQMVEELRGFNKRRNHIAHNPLSYAFDAHSTVCHKYGSINGMTDPERRIGLDEIIQLAELGQELSRGFTSRWMMVMGVPN